MNSRPESPPENSPLERNVDRVAPPLTTPPRRLPASPPSFRKTFAVLRTRTRLLTACLPLLAFALANAAHNRSVAAQETTSHAIIPAYERFRDGRLTDVRGGKLLISELNCQSCHGPMLQGTRPQRQAPILTDAGNRITPAHLRSFLANPHAVKPGTAMPNVLASPDAADIVEALTHFLSSSGSTIPSPVSSGAVTRGKKLFHTVGCAACHGNLEVDGEERPDYAMPLGDPAKKYTVTSLSDFLKNPHAARPSGRMPSLNLSDKEARDVASYLLQDVDVEPNLTYELFRGRWDKIPDFDELTPESTGTGSDFDLTVTDKKERFGLRFSAWLHVPKDGKWKFWLGSDDGSRLLIDGSETLIADGVHPHSTVNKELQLNAGPHPVVVEYFEAGGEQSLKVEISGPGVPRQPLTGLVSKTSTPPSATKGFRIKPELVAKGKAHFVQLGCAACHRHDAVKDAKPPASPVPQFADMKLDGGCLSETASRNAPRFALSHQQRSDLTAALRDLRAHPANAAKADVAAAAPAEAHIADTMLTLNCYACHQRDGFGGVPREQNELFTGSIPEMGDEGRIPPHLDGVGDKLQASWLTEVMKNGAKDRPYMATRMPKFGEHNVGRLIELFAALDERNEVADVEFSDPEHRVIAEARFMVGNKALSCIKCHYFDKHKATGIQSVDLTTMTKRLRRDWFHRYLVNPQAYRPGTRMPGAWPDSRTFLPQVLHGDTAQQIESIWTYLSAGDKAKLPSGLVKKTIELKPTDRPVIYRNFIEGLSARGIAVGYPEQAHIAWDAEQMNLRLIWHGAFMDASRHWTGRGQGFQAPMGDHVIALTAGQPLAELNSPDAAWPTQTAREAGYRFQGYQLDTSGRPRFRYSWKGISVVDFFEAVAGEPDASLLRTVTLSPDEELASIHFRIAAGKKIEKRDDGWLIDGAVLIKMTTGKAISRTVNGQEELIVPLPRTADETTTLSYQLTW